MYTHLFSMNSKAFMSSKCHFVSKSLLLASANEPSIRSSNFSCGAVNILMNTLKSEVKGSTLGCNKKKVPDL